MNFQTKNKSSGNLDATGKLNLIECFSYKKMMILCNLSYSDRNNYICYFIFVG